MDTKWTIVFILVTICCSSILQCQAQSFLISDLTALFNCIVNYVPLPESSIRVHVHLLEPKKNSSDCSDLETLDGSIPLELESSCLRPLNYSAKLEDLRISGLDPDLPFRFFLVGFNSGKFVEEQK